GRRVAGGGADRQATRAGSVDWSLRGGPAGERASCPSDVRRAAARRPGARHAARPAGDSGAARHADGAPLAGAAMSQALDMITRVRGVRGAMLVSAEDGIVVAEQLMEGIKGPAVAALEASLAGRLRRAMDAAGVGAGRFWHVQAERGGLLVGPASGGAAGVAGAEPRVHGG